jgi:hypothetical protein
VKEEATRAMRSCGKARSCARGNAAMKRKRRTDTFIVQKQQQQQHTLPRAD